MISPFIIIKIQYRFTALKRQSDEVVLLYHCEINLSRVFLKKIIIFLKDMLFLSLLPVRRKIWRKSNDKSGLLAFFMYKSCCC